MAEEKNVSLYKVLITKEKETEYYLDKADLK